MTTEDSHTSPNRLFDATSVTRHNRFLQRLAIAGAIILACGVAFAAERVWSNLLVGTFYLLTIALGGALFVALTYVAMTLGGGRQATVGMQMTGIRLARLDGLRIDPLLAIVHTVLFWAGNVFTSGLILLATLVLDRKRTVHDLLLGTVVVRDKA